MPMESIVLELLDKYNIIEKQTNFQYKNKENLKYTYIMFFKILGLK